MTIKGKTVLVTGAAGAIGAEVARQLAAGGARLGLVDLVDDPLGRLVAELAGSGAEAVGTVLDATSTESVAGFAADCAARFGPVTGLVNVAGFFRVEDFTATTTRQWQEMIDANLYTAMAATSAVLPQMLAQGTGAIVNFASTAGEYGSIRPSAAYAAAKGAVIAFTKSLAREVSPAGVRVNAVSPGPVDTSMFADGDAASTAEGAKRTLLGRMGRPVDLARAVVYLVSDDSAFVTGEVLRVNGGSLI